jgi:capsular polysaccharide biosynthesis protein
LRDRRAIRAGRGLALRLTYEQEVLTPVEDIRQAFADDDVQGAAASFAPREHIPEETMKAWMAGRSGGEDPPYWHDGASGAPVHAVTVCRVRQALHIPGFGAVIDRQGRVMRSTVGEALFFTPDLAAMPHTHLADGVTTLIPPADIPRLASGGVFVGWGGRFNYGHFLLDCLPSLAVLRLTGLLDDRPAIAPRLNAWQRESLRLLLGPDADAVLELDAPLVRIDDAAFATPMDHFLHAPNRPLDWVRERMLAQVDRPDTGFRRIYVSRRDDPKRRMLNEGELERDLAARGFHIVRPQTLPVADQIALFRDADVIAAPTGAALANILFCKPTARIFEIQPTNYVGIWTRGVAHFIGAAWHPYYAPSPIPDPAARPRRKRGANPDFQWRIPLQPFLEFLDARL